MRTLNALVPKNLMRTALLILNLRIVTQKPMQVSFVPIRK